MASIERRGFLTSAAAAAAGLSISGLFDGPRAAQAVEPVARNGQAKFKFSLAAYSYRNFLPSTRGKKPASAPQATLTLEDFVADCARFGCDGTELTSYYFPENPTPEYLRSLKALCFRLGLDVTGTAVGNEFTYDKGPDRDKQIAYTKNWIDYAEILGAPVIRIFSGSVHKGQTEAQAHALAVAAIEECCDYAGKHGVFLALENHGGLTAEPQGLLKLVKDVKSPWLGINFDSGNFHSDDPYADLEKIAPYAINAQVKVVMQRGDRKTAKKEPVDMPRLAKILREAGYRGYIVLEYEEDEDPREVCPKFLAEMRAAFT